MSNAYRGRGGRGRPRHRNRHYNPRDTVDTYFGRGSNKRDRSYSPDERSVRRRDESDNRSTQHREDSPNDRTRRREDSLDSRSDAGHTLREESRDSGRGDVTPRVRRELSPYHRPSSAEMDEVARRDLEQQFRRFQQKRDVENAAIKRARETKAAVARASEDVEMTPAAQELVDDSVSPKARGKQKAVEPIFVADSSTATPGKSTNDLDFLDTLWALDEDGNALPPLPSSPENEA
ncbi:hypothetical protein C8F04DRAFT_1278993 [Mycena alexandri]|uniref:Uncharacterized protein n=1 Tax=Mycena alexandri TaxID=1745969 RepID=A0AAD6S0H1_9AGAR|nr:hypothetical protein C8F04DRAFT_1278993 [Mycena alexandri]